MCILRKKMDKLFSFRFFVFCIVLSDSPLLELHCHRTDRKILQEQ